jgi:endoglucanase
MMHEQILIAPLNQGIATDGKTDWNLGFPPEYIDVHSGEVKGAGSSGFSAALLPFLQAGGVKSAAPANAAIQAQAIKADAYYDQVLSLFGLGWREKQFRFNPKGKAEIVWQTPVSDKRAG